MENKFPGKDVTEEDLATKLKLVAKKSPDHRTIVKVGDVVFGGKLIPIMAGPNTVENEAMIVATACAVKRAGAHILRGGAFKPLTFPYRSDKFFELREEGLRLLGIAREKAGIPVITEIMHVDKVAAVGVSARHRRERR